MFPLDAQQITHACGIAAMVSYTCTCIQHTIGLVIVTCLHSDDSGDTQEYWILNEYNSVHLSLHSDIKTLRQMINAYVLPEATVWMQMTNRAYKMLASIGHSVNKYAL